MSGITLSYVETLAFQLPVDEQKLLAKHLIDHSLQKTDKKKQPPRRPGSAVGKFFILAEDDEHLADFEEYMS